YDIAVDSDGNIYISDLTNNRIRKVNASDGKINTVAGRGTPGFFGDNGPALGSAIYAPLGMASDVQKNVYFVDAGNNRIRKINAATGILSTVAGNGLFGSSGNNGQATSARLLSPVSVAIEPNGDILIAGFADVRRVTVSTGIIRYLTGSDPYGFAGDGGPPGNAIWGEFVSVTSAPNGDILLTDPLNFRVRRIHSNTLNTVAGIGIQNNVEATKSFLNSPSGVILNGKGGIWFSDSLFHQIRSVDAGRITALFGDGYPTTDISRTANPLGVARDTFGSLYVADSGNNRILKFVPGGSASVFAGGRGYGYDVPLGTATTAKLASPGALAVDGAGVVYIADTGNCRIRKVSDGFISPVAGNGSCVYSGDDGPGADAGFLPLDIALDGKGGLLIVDSPAHRIRKLDLTTNIITTVAGIGTAGYSGDGGNANVAQLSAPVGIAVDAAGRFYIAEYGNSVVRMVEKGIIRTIAGTGDYVSNGETGPATGIAFDPNRLAVDLDGSLYVTDVFNDRIRKLTPALPAKLEITQGEGASGGTGTAIAVRVKVTEGTGIAVAGIPIRFQVTSGSAQVSTASTNTTSAGIAAVQVTLGATAGAVTVSASADGLAPVTIHLQATAPATEINPGQVIGAGLSAPSVHAISQGAILSVFGKKFGVGAAFQKVGAGDLVNGKVPTQFAGICVDVSGVRALIFGASDTQVNFQAPLLPASGTVAVSVITGCGTAGEISTNAVTLPVQAATPEFFYFLPNLDGHNPVAATDTITGTSVAAANLFPGSGWQPAKPNQYVTVYATGFGETNPAVAPGDFPGGIARVKGSVRVLLNGQVLPADNVLYAGVTPFSPGLYQLNLLLPANTPAGDLPLTIEIGGISSPAGAYLTVKP
ncbi:MAG: hypothetical protein ABI995_09450, partial [Acidobacteriota bacterium]